jgi:hypothetical protein
VKQNIIPSIDGHSTAGTIITRRRRILVAALVMAVLIFAVVLLPKTRGRDLFD